MIRRIFLSDSVGVDEYRFIAKWCLAVFVLVVGPRIYNTLPNLTNRAIRSIFLSGLLISIFNAGYLMLGLVLYQIYK